MLDPLSGSGFPFLRPVLIINAQNGDIITDGSTAPSFSAQNLSGGRNMTEKEKQIFREYLELKAELRKAADRGTKLMVNGYFADPETAATVYVFNEDSCYMRSKDGRVLSVEEKRP